MCHILVHRSVKKQLLYKKERKTTMRLPPLFSLLFLASHQVAEATPWRISSPMAVPRTPLVVAKDITARSLLSASTTVPTGSSANSELEKVKHGDSGELTDNEVERSLSEDLARGGSTMTKSEEEEVGESSVAAADANDTVPATTTPVAHHSHVSRKRARRRKKEKLDGPHALYARKLKNRNHTNIRRKVMHACFGLGFGGLNYFIPRAQFVPGMTILTSATLVMELLRYRKGFEWMNDALHFFLGASLRKHEMEGKFTGSFYFFLGVTITAALYPKTCATMGICQLALADPSASYFGRQTRHVYWSRIENGLWGFGRNKGVLGFIGGALFCFPFNYRVLSLAKLGAEVGGQKSLIFASLALGLAGAFADLAVPTPALTLPKKIFGVPVPPLHVDDNFVVPIVSGYACTKTFEYLGWPTNLQLAKYILF